MRIPEWMYGRIAPRSGLAVRNGIDVGAGVIDSDYRGEIKVLLINHGKDAITLETGSRVAQIVFERIANPTFVMQSVELFDSKDNTARGSGGFGSSGMSKVNYII
jgi:dUTP pyrophosphatase